VPVLCVLIDLVLFSDLVFRSPSVRGESTPRTVVIGYALSGAAVLARRDRRPLLVLLVLCAHSATAALVTSYRPVVLVCVALACLTHRRDGAAVAVGVGGALVCQVTWVLAELRTTPGVATPSLALGVWLSYLVILLLALAAGRWRRVALTAGRAAERWRYQELLRSERRRIGRDLHDSVSHAVTLMVLHADAARRVLATDPNRAKAGLELVGATGSDAIDELGRLLRGLRAAPSGPAVSLDDVPGRHSLADLDRLIDPLRQAGREVGLRRTGGGPVDPRIDLAAYRVVQESLTNALKHAAGGARVDVRVLCDERWLEVEVVNSGDPSAEGLSARGTGPSAHGAGPSGHGAGPSGHGAGPSAHGLAGLAERVALLGGSFTAGPGPDGGFRVAATWPRALAEAGPQQPLTVDLREGGR
jgi:signal transduction histidine kinase